MEDVSHVYHINGTHIVYTRLIELEGVLSSISLWRLLGTAYTAIIHKTPMVRRLPSCQ